MATPVLCVSVGAAILRDWSVPYKQRNSVYSAPLSGLYHRGSKEGKDNIKEDYTNL